VLMVCFDTWITSGDFLEHTLPKIATESLHVRLICHRHAFAFISLCILKSGNDYALHTVACVHFLLKSDFVIRATFQEASGAAICTFCVFSEHNEVDIFNSALS